MPRVESSDEEKRERHLARCKAYYQANKSRLMALQLAARKADPDARKAHDAAYRERHAERVRAAKAAYAAANPDKVRESKRRWRLDNPDKMQAAREQWSAQNPEKKSVHRENRRARERGAEGRLSPGLIERLMHAQSGRCATCKTDVAGPDNHHFFLRKFDLDHIVPLSRGGTNLDSNIQILCRPCNRRKGSRAAT